MRSLKAEFEPPSYARSKMEREHTAQQTHEESAVVEADGRAAHDESNDVVGLTDAIRKHAGVMSRDGMSREALTCLEQVSI